jgi:hypothetical protein
MSEPQTVPLVQKFRPGDCDAADPAFVGNLQRSTNSANENCDRALTLAHKLSAQLREAHDWINQLEREADGLFHRLLAKAQTAVANVE